MNPKLSARKGRFVEDYSSVVWDDYLDLRHRKLVSLEGCPQIVNGSFDCSHNNLASLKGCPQTISGSFDCSYNNLTSLKGCPQRIGVFNCKYNKLSVIEILKFLSTIKNIQMIFSDFDDTLLEKWCRSNKQKKIKMIFEEKFK